MLTAKQRELLDFIAAHQARQGTSPSFEEMMLGLGLKSKSGVHRLISALEERGFIRRLPNRARALEIIADPEEQKAIRRRDRNISLLHLSNDELLRECFRRNLVRKAA